MSKILAENAAPAQSDAKKIRKKRAKQEAKALLQIEQAHRDVQKAERSLAKAQIRLEKSNAYLRELEEQLEQLQKPSEPLNDNASAPDTLVVEVVEIDISADITSATEEAKVVPDLDPPVDPVSSSTNIPQASPSATDAEERTSLSVEAEEKAVPPVVINEQQPTSGENGLEAAEDNTPQNGSEPPVAVARPSKSRRRPAAHKQESSPEEGQ